MMISVIIPVYNTVDYLEQCIYSITNQTYRNLEIICIDDGSTDGSAEKLDELASLDERIRVVHKENGGATSARKAGVEIATGAYIGCIDSDDWIDENMYESLYNIAISQNVDLVTCGYYLEGSYTTIHMDTVEEGLYDKTQIQKLRDRTIYNMNCRETGLRGSLGCKLFRTDIFRKVQLAIPDELILAEDKMCLLAYMLECNSAYVLKKALYHWVIHSNSMSHMNRNDYLLKINSVYNYLIDIYKHPNFSSEMRTQAEIYITELIFLGINKRMGFKNRNMIWIDPYWMEKIPKNSKIALYGGGELGEKYKKQLEHTRPDILLVGCIDLQYEKLSNEYLKVSNPNELCNWNYDFVVITIKNKGKALSTKEELIALGVENKKIIWCEQPEAYWKYIEAEGIN